MRAKRFIVALGAFVALALHVNAESGKLTRDLTVGPAKDVQLKSGQVVQVMKHSGSSVVIMVQMPDGSNGVYQVDADAVAADTPAPAPTTTPATQPATNPAPVTPAPAAQTTPVPVTPPPAPATPPPAAASDQPPTYPDGFVGGPEVSTTDGERAAGTASVIKVKGGTQSYILSARHLLGPDGGFPKQTAAADVPAFVKSITIHAFSGGTHTYQVTGLLVSATALKAIGAEPINDLAVYLNKDNSPQTQAVALADAMPAMGTPLWVVARVRGGVPEGQIMQSGKVTGTKKFIELRFDNDNIITAGASGAPVLNAAGEVVGVYSGHAQTNGHMYGYIVPAPLIASVIKQQAPPAQ